MTFLFRKWPKCKQRSAEKVVKVKTKEKVINEKDSCKQQMVLGDLNVSQSNDYKKVGKKSN